MQLKALVAEMKIAGTVKVNGITEAKDQVLKLAQAALKVKDDWNRAFDSAWSEVNRFYLNTSRTLPALVDDFNTAMRKIASTMGTNSAEGRKLVAAEVTKMVGALTAGMLSGKVSVTQGMAAINTALKTGVHSGAITWTDQWHQMFQSVETLYSHHKISTATYLADLRQITSQGYAHIHSDTKASEQAMYAYLQDQWQRGNLTHGQMLAKWHTAQAQANVQQAHDMQNFAGSVILAMSQSGGATARGVKAVITALDDALGPLGAAKIPIPSLAADAKSIVSAAVSAASAVTKAGGGYIGATRRCRPRSDPDRRRCRGGGLEPPPAGPGRDGAAAARSGWGSAISSAPSPGRTTWPRAGSRATCRRWSPRPTGSTPSTTPTCGAAGTRASRGPMTARARCLTSCTPAGS